MATYEELEFSGVYPKIPMLGGGELDLATAGSEEILAEGRAQDPNPYLNHVGRGREVVERLEEMLIEHGLTEEGE